MLRSIVCIAIFVSSISASQALAKDENILLGIDVSTGMAKGSSGTKNAGAPWGGGGIVRNVDFDNQWGIGGHFGYRFTPNFSAYGSYHFHSGDVSWDADFPVISQEARFDGDAFSHLILANIGYDLPLSNNLSLSASLGGGVSFNRLSGIREYDRTLNQFAASIKSETHASPAAQLGLGLTYKIGANSELGLAATVAYSGEFRTGITRKGNMGVTEINRYKIDDVWRANIMASYTFHF